MTRSGINWSMKAQEKLRKKQQDSFTKPFRDNPEFKAYDIVFAGRKTELLYNGKTGEIVVEGMLFKPSLTQDENTVVAKVGEHEYKIGQSGGQTFLDGRLVEFSYTPSVPKLVRKSSKGIKSEIIRSPLPGLITELFVKEGDIVDPGAKILILEAMKMQNEIITESGGKVDKILVKEGDQTETHQDLVFISKSTKDNE